MVSKFTAACIVATAFATAPPEEEFISGSRRWKGLRVSMDQYDTYYFDNRIEHFDPTDSRTYK